jgi:hypothetical protein
MEKRGVSEFMRLKASWTVNAGVLPGIGLSTFHKRWEFTSQDDEQDQQNNSLGDPAYHSLFAKMRAEAMDYYLQVSLPHLNNWATLEFVWY